MLALLDSNVWRYVVDQRALPMLLQAQRNSKHRIAIAPAVVYEAARTQEKVLRDKLLAAMIQPAWKRLMPEACSEAAEITEEVVRLRPQWLRHAPETLYRRLRHDWVRTRGGFWDRIRKDTDAEAKRIADTDLVQLARDQAVIAREEGKTMSKWQDLPISSLLAQPPTPVKGWRGEPVELWRLNSWLSFRYAMTRPGHPYVDWMCERVDLVRIAYEESSLLQFFFYDVEAIRLRRQWIRTALEYLQRFQRVTDGTPADSQLGTYLVEVDLMLSADKNFVRIANHCREQASFPIAASTLIPGGPQAVEAAISFLQTGNASN